MQSPCPHCQNVFEVDARLMGREIGCPYCNRTVRLHGGPVTRQRARKQSQALPVIAVLLFVAILYAVGGWFRLWPVPAVLSQTSMGQPRVEILSASTTDELSTLSGPTMGGKMTINSTGSGPKRTFVVLKLRLNAQVLDLQRLDDKELKEVAGDEPDKMPKEADWHKYELKAGQFRLLKPDGESILAAGWDAGAGFGQASSMTTRTFQKPKSAEISPFFVVEIDTAKQSALRFQFKDETPIPVPLDNASK